ncbi:MAG: replicative DNA helicase [Spirochaetia bacterium]
MDRYEPPSDMEAEGALLGTLLLSFKQVTLDYIQRYIGAEDFYKPAHQHVFRAILALLDRGANVDAITVADELRAQDLLERVGGMGYLAQLTSSPPSTAHTEEYTRIIYEHALRRKLVDFGDLIKRESMDRSKTAEAVLEKAEQDIFALNQSQQSSSYHESKSLVKQVMLSLEERKNSKSLYTGVPTELIELDGLLSGLQDSEMIVIGARPSVGKTALALSILDNIAVRQGMSCGFFSLEMPAKHLYERLFASQARINSKKLRNPSLLTAAEWGALGDAAGRLYEAPICIDDTPNIRLVDLRSQARKMKANLDIKVLFIDYLGLITVDNQGIPRYEQMALVSRSIKALARELSIPVVILSQLRRDAEGKEPNLADLRETGAIEQDADVVMFLHRERSSEEHSHDIIETKLILAKQRNGPVGVLKLAFVPKYARYENMDHH